MGLFDYFSKKEVSEPKRAKPTQGVVCDPKQSNSKTCLIFNQRKDIRYLILPIDTPLGEIIQMSKSGIRVKKKRGTNIDYTELLISIDTSAKPVKAEIIWQNNEFLGIRLIDTFDSGLYIKKNLLTLIEGEFPPDMTLTFLDISRYKQYDFLTPLTNLMAELEYEDTNMQRLKIYVDNLHEVRQKVLNDEAIEEEKRKKSKTATQTQIDPKYTNIPDLKEQLMDRAMSGMKYDINTADINLAIARLGVDNVKKISSDFVKKNISRFEISISSFKSYQIFNILKTVMFKKLAMYFGYKNEGGEGSSLLSLETTGIRILTQKREKELGNYYTSPLRLYSDISRIYESLLFGHDFLHVTKTYFEKVVGVFQKILDGYLISHQTLNPQYRMPKAQKMVITKNNLNFGFVAYLTMLGTTFIMDNDRDNGIVFIKKLLRTGIEDSKVMELLNEIITDANIVASEMGIRSNMRLPAYPMSNFKLDSFIPQDKYFEYLLKNFRNFASYNATRIVLRYDDDVYCHYVLGKFLNIPDFGFDSKIFTVIPCENLADKEILLEDIEKFDIVVFKNIDRLPYFHLRSFMRLWTNFEGKIIATIGNDRFIDFDNQDLFKMVNPTIVDFPSSFMNLNVQKKMIVQTLLRLKPFIHKPEFDPTPYLKDNVSSLYILKNELFNNPPFMFI
ncbi:MAG: hypothetical protein N3A62_02295 [Thermodesulfovibrionales bacterium]|nr:hypothetical protein [Thermodesulfovibrionales bacterium]